MLFYFKSNWFFKIDLFLLGDEKDWFSFSCTLPKEHHSQSWVGGIWEQELLLSLCWRCRGPRSWVIGWDLEQKRNSQTPTGHRCLLCRHAVPHHFQLPLFHKYCCVVRTHTRGRFNLMSRFKKSDCSLFQTRISFTGKANILSKKDQWHTASTSAVSKLSTIFVNNISWVPRHTNLFTHCLWLLLCYKGRTEVVRH